MGYGLAWGLFMFLGYTVLATLIYVATGGEAFRRNDVTLPVTVLTYFVAGVVGGIAGGLLLPLTNTRRGSVLFGIVVAIPVCACFTWALWGPVWSWGGREITATLSTAVVLGGVLGWSEWVPPGWLEAGIATEEREPTRQGGAGPDGP